MGAPLHTRPGLTIGRLAGRLLLLTAAALCVWQAPFEFGNAGRAISRWAGAGPQERELEPARAVEVDPRVLLAAARLIPPRSVYYVAPGSTRSGIAYVARRPLSFYWLFPRRYTNDAHRARWVLGYGNGLKRLGLSYSAVWRVAPDAVVAKVRQ